jgi:putative ABC transport system permease protein
MIELLLGTARTLRAHAFRFALTSLGVSWGTLMLTLLTASSLGVDRHFTREIEEVGPRVVWLFPGTIVKERIGERGARDVELEIEDTQRMAALDSVLHAAPNVLEWSTIVRAEGRTKLFGLYGVVPETQSIRSFDVAAGRFIAAQDVRDFARVAFLGADVAKRLFGPRNPVGETVHVESLPFRVVGVAASKGDQLVNMGGQDDKSLLIPETTMRRWITREQPLKALVFEPKTREESATAIWNVREIIGLHHGFDPNLDTAISFVNIQDVIRIVETIGVGLRIFLIGAGLLTIAVGAIGVMNIMLVVVGERRREIGLRKALGATDRDVFVQFLAETGAVCLLAGMLGLAGGMLAVEVLAWSIGPNSGFMSKPVIEPAIAAGVAIVLVFVGVAAGLLPALRAARVEPAEALRAP